MSETPQKKLFKVHIEWQTVIRASSKEDATNQAEYVIRNYDDPCEHVQAEEITDLNQLPPNWDENCRPWGDPDPKDRTIGEMLHE